MKYPAVKDRLKWMGMTHMELADRVGIKWRYMNNMLSGQNKMDVDTALKISNVLGKSVEELFSEVVEEDCDD
jgi:plasmid maintenance system antidote protein VapI